MRTRGALPHARDRALPGPSPTSTDGPPTGPDGGHPVAPCDRALDNLAVVRCSGNDGDAPLERVELFHAALPARANHLVAAIQRVLHHVLPELPGRPDVHTFILCT